MSEELDKRKKRVLQAIIEEYIDTAEPVSSGNLVKELDCSSATIRNEMAELEKIGYLEKPHTSAGRIPSQKGYRYYVDELLREDKLSKKEMEIIKERLETKVNALEDLFPEESSPVNTKSYVPGVFTSYVPSIVQVGLLS